MRALIAEAQTAGLERLDAEARGDPDVLVTSLRETARYRIRGGSEETGAAGGADAYARLRLAMLQSEREAVLLARPEGRLEESTVQARYAGGAPGEAGSARDQESGPESGPRAARRSGFRPLLLMDAPPVLIRCKPVLQWCSGMGER